MRVLNSLMIRPHPWVGFAAVLVLALTLGLFSIDQISVINPAPQDAATYRPPPIRALSIDEAQRSDSRRAAARFALSFEPAGYGRLEEPGPAADKPRDLYPANVDTEKERHSQASGSDGIHQAALTAQDQARWAVIGLLAVTISMGVAFAAIVRRSPPASVANAVTEAAPPMASAKVVRQVDPTMKDITERSHKIVDIVGMVESIAFQTNILALNAAAEAARTDAQGRGFSAVAYEVRSLAQRAASSAKEIKGLLDSHGATGEIRAASLADMVPALPMKGA